MKNIILIIDDDLDFVEAIKMLLEANDYKVITASNGKEGFQKVKKESPHLIILDMMMTYKTEGADTARAITADASTRKIPIIMITGAKKELSFPFDLKPDKKTLPVKTIIEKPVDPESLLKKITEYIESSDHEHFRKKDEAKIVSDKWRAKKGNLIMILHEIQNKFGYIPRDTSFNLSRELNIPMARIYEVISFYNYFQLEPPGKHTISVCMGTACYLKGAPLILDEIKNILNIEEGQVTKDGLFKLMSVRCLGCCGLAPVMTIDNKVYGKLKKEDIIDIISSYDKIAKK